jgi:hypothetical protein
MTNKRFEEPLWAIPSRGRKPATARVLLELGVDGKWDISSTLKQEETIEALDQAMESIDGQRLPPDNA